MTDITRIDTKTVDVNRIEVSKDRVMFFNDDICVHEISLPNIPNFDNGEALNINLTASVLFDR